MNEPINNTVKDDTPIPAKSWWQRLLALLIIAALLFGGWNLTNHLMNTSPKAKRKKPHKLQTLVTTQKLIPTNAHVTVSGLGQVIPAREIELKTRVTGQVVFLHPNMIPGGLVGKDEVLARLDQEDYMLAIQLQENTLAQAEADLEIEEGSQTVAREEWQLINKISEDVDQSSRDLALRKPQLTKARLSIESAKTDLAQARLDLQRTVLKAPFNAVVRDKSVDLGSQVASQSSIATLIGTDLFWAEISVAQEKLPWLTLPGPGRQGSPVTVHGSGGRPHEGRILNLLTDLEEDGLMVRLLIAIQDPLGLHSDSEPLLLGSFIRAEIQGKELRQIYRIPRSSLKNGDTVMLADPESQLLIRSVHVLWKDADFAFIDQGLTEGERLVISSIATPVPGMELKIVDQQATENNGQSGTEQ